MLRGVRKPAQSVTARNEARGFRPGPGSLPAQRLRHQPRDSLSPRGGHSHHPHPAPSEGAKTP